MPRPRAGEGHVGCYKRSGSLPRNAPALCRGRLRYELLAARMRLMQEQVAASRNNVVRRACSSKREAPRRKVAASAERRLCL